MPVIRAFFIEVSSSPACKVLVLDVSAKASECVGRSFRQTLCLTEGYPEIVLHHLADNFRESVGGFPAEHRSRLRCVTYQGFNLGWTVEALINTNVVAIVEAHLRECQFTKFAHGV